jgi:hypothetical protein
MLLLPWVALTLVAFLVFVLGAFFDYLGVATVGATLLIAVGAGVAVDDLETQTGVDIERNVTTVPVNQNGTIVNETVVDGVQRTPQYETVAIIREFGDTGPLAVGGLQMLVGGLLFSRRLDDAR